MFKYMQRGFLYGAAVGTAYGLYQSGMHVKFSKVPRYAFIFGTTYAVFHGMSAFFRHEI